jgi:transposase-like protein
MNGLLLEHFPENCTTEADCEDYLFRLRWSEGFHCPRCDHESYYKVKTRKLYECRECRTQVSLTAGTVMHNSKLSLITWFQVINLLVGSDKEWTASSLAQHIGVNYRTARLMINKMIWALNKKKKVEQEPPLPETQVPQSQENNEIIQKLQQKSIALQKEKQRIKKLSRIQYSLTPRTRSNSPCNLVKSWLSAFLSVSLYPNLLRYWQC